MAAKIIIADPNSEYVRTDEDMQFASILLQAARNAEEGNFEDIPVDQEIELSDAVDIDKPDWTYSETIALINSMKHYYEYLKHAKKRKHVFEHVCKDLLNEGIICNADMCFIRWKSLVRSYTIAKDKQNRTGKDPSGFQFFYEMDSILGTNPLDKCVHVLDSSNLKESIAAIENVYFTSRGMSFINISDSSADKEVDGSQESMDIPGKHIWKYSETVALLKSMSKHYENLGRTESKESIFDHVSNDLLNEGITCSASLCLKKWKLLVRSYNESKYNYNKTGKGPSRFQFYHEMDSILGRNPIEDSISQPDTNCYNCKVENDVSTNEDEILNNNRTHKKRRLETHIKTEQTEDEYERTHEDNRNRRHQERMEIEKIKIGIEKQKINLLKKYLEFRQNEETDDS